MVWFIYLLIISLLAMFFLGIKYINMNIRSAVKISRVNINIHNLQSLCVFLNTVEATFSGMVRSDRGCIISLQSQS